MSDLTLIERRVLSYLDQRGPSHRAHIAGDLAAEGTNTAVHQNGSNGAVPLIVGNWCRRLKASGLVAECRQDGFYRHHEITPAGRAALRATPNPEHPHAG